MKNIPSDLAQGYGIRKIPSMLGFTVIWYNFLKIQI
jgi:hypothetical protein